MDVEIIWYGQTCFRISGRNSISIVNDPYCPDAGPPFPALDADIVTISHRKGSCDHLAAIQRPFRLLDGPGEYEISGVFITGVSTFADGDRGLVGGLNTVFAFDFGDTTVCHLGRLGHVPTQSQVKNLGPVNVLLVPVGGGGSLKSTEASEVIGLFEPDVVVPMRYRITSVDEELDSVGHFLREMGMEDADRQEALTVSESSALEETKIVLLQPAGNRR
jgi:L-ascorbate metabolism protein UlaG (beta-lactamase superfamily)